MRLPVIKGTIKRRILVNYRADPEVIQKILPTPFRPKLHNGHALVGICLIRLENIRPARLPAAIGLSSENAFPECFTPRRYDTTIENYKSLPPLLGAFPF